MTRHVLYRKHKTSFFCHPKPRNEPNLKNLDGKKNSGDRGKISPFPNLPGILPSITNKNEKKRIWGKKRPTRCLKKRLVFREGSDKKEDMGEKTSDPLP